MKTTPKDDNKIYTDQKIDGTIFFWGWDINFEYQGNKFKWDNYGYIYLIENGVLTDSGINAEKITSDTLTKNLQRCIDKLKNPIQPTN